MTAPVIFEPPLLHPEQMSDKKPWERQEGESAKWYWRFRNYLNLGPKRSVNAAFEVEHKEKQEKSRTKAGPEWYGAAKRYQWEARADAWDREQDEQKAAILRQIAMRCAFVSRPFRITQLNALADGLMREVEKGCEATMFLAITRQMQALMHDIAEEVQSWNVTLDASSDAAALGALEDKHKRMGVLQQERDQVEEEAMDTMLAQLVRLSPDLIPPGDDAERILAQLERGESHAKIAEMIRLRTEERAKQ